MKDHDFSLDEALRQFLLGDDPVGSPVPDGWIKGPSLADYEAHARGRKPFTPEQMAWAKANAACRRTLEVFEQRFGVPVKFAAATTGVESEVAWDEKTGRGQIRFDFGAALAGSLMFLRRVGEGLVGVLRLDSQGRAASPRLLPGEYSLVPSFRSGFLAALTVGGDFAPRQTTGGNVPASIEQERDLESGVRASIKILGTDAEVAFSTENPELEDATVHLAFIRPESTEVQLSAAVVLSRSQSHPGRWTGAWRYPIPLTGRLEIAFAIERKRHG